MIKIRFKKRIKSFATKGEKVKEEKGREKFDLAFDGYSNNLNEIFAIKMGKKRKEGEKRFYLQCRKSSRNPGFRISNCEFVFLLSPFLSIRLSLSLSVSRCRWPSISLHLGAALWEKARERP